MGKAGRLSVALAMLATGTLIGAVAQRMATAEIGTGDRTVLVPLPGPCRLIDTRPASVVGPRTTPLGPAETYTIQGRPPGATGNCTAIPAAAQTLSLNVTADRPSQVTFLTIWPDGPRPIASSLNPAPGPPMPNAVTVALSATGTFNVFNSVGNVDLIIDVVGYYEHHNHDDIYPPPGVDHAFGPQELNLGGAPEPVVSLTLNAPAPGFAIVTANGYTYLGTGGLDQVHCSITNGAVAIDTNREFWTDDHGHVGGDPYLPFSSTRVYPVVSGANTFRLVCDENNGAVAIRDSMITALWVPALY